MEKKKIVQEREDEERRGDRWRQVRSKRQMESVCACVCFTEKFV